MKCVALYPGSFDPFTVGHLDIVQRLSPLYDEVVVAVLSNPKKTPYLPEEARVRSIEESVKGLSNVRVLCSAGATGGRRAPGRRAHHDPGPSLGDGF